MNDVMLIKIVSKKADEVYMEKYEIDGHYYDFNMIISSIGYFIFMNCII